MMQFKLSGVLEQSELLLTYKALAGTTMPHNASTVVTAARA